MSAHAAPNAPVVVDIYTRGTAAKNPVRAVLTVDLTHLFNMREAPGRGSAGRPAVAADKSPEMRD